MRAMVLETLGGRLASVNRPPPQPGPNQLLIRVCACAVCRTDLHVVDGELPDVRVPLVPGHEIVGRVVAAGAGAETVAAQGAGDALAGRALATRWCSNCHQIGPERGSAANDAIPSFPDIAAMPSTTALSIRVFLRSSHRNMPNFHLSESEIDDVGAYVLGLRPRGP